ncbi:MAG TPA: nucleotidyltransferase substrate binding protein [Bdellovibrionota bacterium]|nr:nucleotidyltransferase substrate binding protein [Bdellovibrionota bacterium]
MRRNPSTKLHNALLQLEKAVEFYAKNDDDRDLRFLAVVKSFEILTEYLWRRLKTYVEDEGLDAPSPKEAIRQAAKLELLDDPERWIDFINARNDSVHDYFGIPEKDFVELVRDLLVRANRLSKALNEKAKGK